MYRAGFCDIIGKNGKILQKLEEKEMSKENNETKLCKHCKTEIPAGAKVCPNCRKKQGGAGKWIAIVILAVVIFAAVSGGGDDDKVSRVEPTKGETAKQQEKQSEKAVTTTAQETEDSSFGIGDTAEFKDIRATLTNITESNGSEFNKPSDGNVFVLAEFEIENNSEKELTISSIMSFDAYQDGYATSQSLTALLEKEGEQLDGTIAPGKKMKGSIGYEIPADYKELEINLQLDVWSNKKIVFVYKK